MTSPTFLKLIKILDGFRVLEQARRTEFGAYISDIYVVIFSQTLQPIHDVHEYWNKETEKRGEHK